MRIIRYVNGDTVQVAAVTDDDKVYDLPFDGIISLVKESERKSMLPVQMVNEMIHGATPTAVGIQNLSLLVPVEAPEVWASGVTYEDSRNGRNFEATGGNQGNERTFYDKVYDAERPEIFLKSTKARTVGPGDEVYLRTDSSWQIPEPEIGLVLNGEAKIIGYTIGNDMSCRDIEGENPLYLPQAKIWQYSCAIGPAIRLAETVVDPYNLRIYCRIYRNGDIVFEGAAGTHLLKRKFDELASYLRRDNIVFEGSVLLTGTCIVPPNEFTLQEGDNIEIEVPSIGTLQNPVRQPLAQEIKG